ncbi:MAG: extracellular solute-binding protein [Chloroflexi bacterium]|nr:extracellular solute-binding protein [Chloroflexota bacterium]
MLAVSALIMACTPGVTPSPAPQVKATSEKPAPGTGWEQRWETTLAAARREGKVGLYTLWGPEVTGPITKAFKDRYGIDIESTVGRGSALLPKVQAENRAGLHLADAFGVGANSLLTTMKPAGVLGSMENVLMLPEVTDPKVWVQDRIPFIDKDKTAIAMIMVIQRHILFNTTMIKEGEITNYKDLLKPQYKGKIALNDISVTGGGNSFFAHLALDLWNVEETSQFFRQIITQQEAVISSDNRVVAEWVARGKYAIGLAAARQAVAEFINIGAPVSLAVVKEGSAAGISGGALGIPDRVAHPNASTIYVNWMLTREAQTLFMRGYGFPSLRKDVPPEGMHPLFLPMPGEKLYPDSEEGFVEQAKLLDITRKIMDDARK